MEINTYMQWVKALLPELGKYFLVLLLAVLAIRLWRRCLKTAAGQKRISLGLALLISSVAATVGYVSVCHSLSRLYCAYGHKAFEDGNMRSAFTLFQQARDYWKSADATGQAGISLLLLGEQEAAVRYLAEAKALRHGQTSPFEDFYAGLYYFLHEQPKQAAPFLEASRREQLYWGNATKLLAVIALEDQRPAEAAQLMAPLRKADVKDWDQAYVIASLELAEGKTGSARTVLEQFTKAEVPAFWKPRFERLLAQVKTKAS